MENLFKLHTGTCISFTSHTIKKIVFYCRHIEIRTCQVFHIPNAFKNLGSNWVNLNVLNSYKTQTLSQTRQVSWKRHACSSFKLIKYWYRSKVKFNTWWFKWNPLHVFLLQRAGWICPFKAFLISFSRKALYTYKDIGKYSKDWNLQIFSWLNNSL